MDEATGPVQISKPLPKFGIGKVAEGIFVNLFIGLEKPGVSRFEIGEEQAIEGFGMLPPKFAVGQNAFHAVDRQSFRINIIKDPSEFPIPAPIETPSDEINPHLPDGGVGMSPGFMQKKIGK